MPPLSHQYTWTPWSSAACSSLDVYTYIDLPWNGVQKHAHIDSNACCSTSRWFPWQLICKWMCFVLITLGCGGLLPHPICKRSFHNHDKTGLVKVALTGLKEPTIERWFCNTCSWMRFASLSGGVGAHYSGWCSCMDRLMDFPNIFINPMTIRNHERSHRVKLGMNLDIDRSFTYIKNHSNLQQLQHDETVGRNEWRAWIHYKHVRVLCNQPMSRGTCPM